MVDGPLLTVTERDAAPGMLPVTVRASRPGTDRREDDDPEEGEPEPEPPDPEPPELPEPPEDEPDEPDPVRAARPALVRPVGGEAIVPVGETTGASPHWSQYSSPSPTSSYRPSQPGRWQSRARAVPCATPHTVQYAVPSISSYVPSQSACSHVPLMNPP
ncbi:hypothetical protein GCM10010359_53510 [Streptomyces morookaense]|nr:hypothetical protein GCM10010359_53510 [Streptomyces morookaense]